MTYTVSSGTLNPSIPYHTRLYHVRYMVLWRWWCLVGWCLTTLWHKWAISCHDNEDYRDFHTPFEQTGYHASTDARGEFARSHRPAIDPRTQVVLQELFLKINYTHCTSKEEDYLNIAIWLRDSNKDNDKSVNCVIMKENGLFRKRVKVKGSILLQWSLFS